MYGYVRFSEKEDNMSLLFANRSACELADLPVNCETDVSLESEQFRTVRTLSVEKRVGVATPLRLHRCLQCARGLQVEHRRSAGEGSPGNRTMEDRPGNERE